VLITSAAILALIRITTLVRTTHLRTGAAMVVRESGGVDIGANPQDPERQCLRNLL